MNRGLNHTEGAKAEEARYLTGEISSPEMVKQFRKLMSPEEFNALQEDLRQKILAVVAENIRLQNRAESAVCVLNELEEETTKDHLTGLLNLKGLREAYKQIHAIDKRNEKTTSVIFFDLDGFKALNNERGYDEADKILVKISTGLREILPRDSDAISRRGGDEFAIILSGTDTTNAAAIAEKIRSMVEKLKDDNGNKINVTASLGVVSTSLEELKDDNTWSKIVEIAAGTMMLAKDAGKNGVLVCDSEIYTQATERFQSDKTGSLEKAA